MAHYYWVTVSSIVIAVVSFGLQFILAEVFPWKKIWRQRKANLTVNTKSYKGRTVLITGANGAFGSRAAKLIAIRDVDTLILLDVKDCAGVRAEIEAECHSMMKIKPTILVWQVDMMSYSSCQEFARKAQQLKSLDHVLLAAGILSFNRCESPEGWESTWDMLLTTKLLAIQVNYLSTALLALILLPLLKSSPTNPNPPVLTFVTSFGVYPASPTMYMSKTGSYLRHLSNNKDGMAQAHQYGRSKALLLYFARELATRVSVAWGQGRELPKVTINSADPGSAWTPLTNPNQAQLIPNFIMNFSAREPLICATALVNGVSASEDQHGKLVIDNYASSYPPFIERKSGRAAQQRVWQETRDELEKNVPEVRATYKILDS